MVKKQLIKPGSLDKFGFEGMVNGPDEREYLESFIRSGVPCVFYSAYYLIEWKKKFLVSY